MHLCIEGILYASFNLQCPAQDLAQSWHTMSKALEDRKGTVIMANGTFTFGILQ